MGAVYREKLFGKSQRTLLTLNIERNCHICDTVEKFTSFLNTSKGYDVIAGRRANWSFAM